MFYLEQNFKDKPSLSGFAGCKLQEGMVGGAGSLTISPHQARDPVGLLLPGGGDVSLIHTWYPWGWGWGFGVRGVLAG